MYIPTVRARDRAEEEESSRVARKNKIAALGQRARRFIEGDDGVAGGSTWGAVAAN